MIKKNEVKINVRVTPIWLPLLSSSSNFSQSANNLSPQFLSSHLNWSVLLRMAMQLSLGSDGSPAAKFLYAKGVSV